jgi:hypothetical protein
MIIAVLHTHTHTLEPEHLLLFARLQASAMVWLRSLLLCNVWHRLVIVRDISG